MVNEVNCNVVLNLREKKGLIADCWSKRDKPENIKIINEKQCFKVNPRIFYKEKFSHNKTIIYADKLYYNISNGIFYYEYENGTDQIYLNTGYRQECIKVDKKVVSPEIKLCLIESRNDVEIYDLFVARISMIVASSYFNTADKTILYFEHDNSLSGYVASEVKFHNLPTLDEAKKQEAILLKILNINPYLCANESTDHHINISYTNFISNKHFYNFVSSFNNLNDAEYTKIFKRLWNLYSDYKMNIFNSLVKNGKAFELGVKASKPMDFEKDYACNCKYNFIHTKVYAVEIRGFAGISTDKESNEYYNFLKKLLYITRSKKLSPMELVELMTGKKNDNNLGN